MGLNAFLCKTGIHKWNRATHMDYSAHSNVEDWKQRCVNCGKMVTWVQPKGLNERFYPIYWTKRRSWLFWLVLIIIGYSVYRYFF